VEEEKGTMEGREGVTMEGGTQLERALRPSQIAQRTGVERVTAGAGGRIEALRARLIAATVETVAEGSHPRLAKTRYARTAA
jgi:hypothetical protein